jgi:hypothetical protein
MTSPKPTIPTVIPAILKLPLLQKQHRLLRELKLQKELNKPASQSNPLLPKTARKNLSASAVHNTTAKSTGACHKP